MKIIMCSDSLNKNQPTSLFQKEYDTASRFGKVYLFDFYDLEKESLDQILPSLPDSNNETIYYQGWMMNEHQYNVFYQHLLTKGYRLINSPQQYLNCHHFNNWYPVIQDLTAESLIINLTELTPLVIESVLNFQKKVKSALIIKDYVSSLKHQWNEACFIPQDATPLQVSKVISSFLQYKKMYNDFVGGLVVRQFVPLRQIGLFDKSNLPISQEFRFFVHRGKVISQSIYWNQGSYTNDQPDLDLVNKIADRIYNQLGSNLFTIDLACQQNGKWICIEVGDGQVSSLPEQADKESFYSKLLGV